MTPRPRNPGKADDEFMHKACAELRRRTTSLSVGPLELSAAFQDHRRSIFIDPGFEGLTASQATYHLTDAAGYLSSACAILATGDGGSIPVRYRPLRALRCVMQGHGWRYVRGVQGLADAIAEKHPRELSRFRERRAAFEGDLTMRAIGAHITNEDGGCPAAVVKVLRTFIEEMRALTGWLERVGEAAHGAMISNSLERSERILDDCEANKSAPQPSRRGSRRR